MQRYRVEKFIQWQLTDNNSRDIQNGSIISGIYFSISTWKHFKFIHFGPKTDI